MRLTKPIGIAAALVAAAFVGATVIGSAFAIDEPGTAELARPKQAYCELFLDNLAAELGTDRDGLLDAGRAAANATVDAALEAGDLDARVAERLRDRIAAADGSGCGWLLKGFGHGRDRGLGAGRGLGHGPVGAGRGLGLGPGLAVGPILDAAAEALGIDPGELVAGLRDTGSLEAVADEHGIAYDHVRAAVLETAQARLDEAVAEGMPQERADAALERLTTWLDEGGRLGGPRDGHGNGRGWGWGRGGQPFGDPHEADDDPESDR